MLQLQRRTARLAGATAAKGSLACFRAAAALADLGDSFVGYTRTENQPSSHRVTKPEEGI